ncbi:peptidase S8/S53 domain-containing protein [Zychaea mexicana]|uniref:peptidase S8/S53 domain-containing protein n=1 Tax=Zychaea mexicana TaxID=64656 RepID=UPI0022FF2887|nr:peptidase S8/S53 domain-containing protein [Zychaea mexicana]KAI9488326.1 peptidase S8/S53 domain-containing protein [Zychaea mexicana]
MPRLFDHDLLKGAIVQIEQKPSSSSRSAKSRSKSDEQPTLSLLSTDEDSLFDDIFNSMAKSGLVTNVYPVRVVQRPDTAATTAANGIDIDKLLPHSQTQVDRVHNELNNTGKGITVGIIDSGVDYMHPALGGGFGEGYKVRYGKDLVGDDYDANSSNSTPVPDDDPMDACVASTGASGHGTHVSGIVAGKSDNFTGVAPDATLGMWRVFGCTGSASDDVIIDAMLDAYDTGVDIISMSLGDTYGWPEGASAVVAERITAKGVPVIIAAGNEGATGAFTVSVPSVGHGAYSVASFDNNYNLMDTFQVDGSTETYGYAKGSPTPSDIPNGRIVAGDKNVGSNSDACDASNIPSNVSGNLAIVQRGSCAFDDKANNLAKAGAVGVVVFNTEGQDVFTPSTPNATIPVVGIAYDVGNTILADIEKGDTSVTFADEQQVRPVNTGNTVSSFSSVGASYELDFAPSIAGVGGNIYSTLPRQLGTWGIMSGTSMATPYVSGSVALFLNSLKGKKTTPAFILEQFQNYAFKAPNKNGEDNIDSPFKQGAGLVQVYDAIQQQVHVSPGGISFNDTANLHKTYTLTITNNGDSIVSYQVLNNVSVSVVPYGDREEYQFTEPATYGIDSAKLRFSKKSIKISPGKSAKLDVTVIPPKSNPADHIMYGGYVQLKSQQKQKDITIPYMGIVGNQHELPIYGYDTPYLTNSTDGTYVFGPNDTYVYDRTSGTAPIFIIYMNNPTREIQAPLYNEKGKKIGYAFTDLTLLGRSTSSNAGIMVQWFGTYTPTLFNVQLPITLRAPAGKYRIGLNALKWLGNPKEDWEEWTSGVIQVK